MNYEIGQRQNIDGIDYEITSIGRYVAEDDLQFEEGRIPEAGDEMLGLIPDDRPDMLIVYQPVGVVEQRKRKAAMELVIDSRMPTLRKMLLSHGEMLSVETAAAFMRAAFGTGYVFARNEEPPGGFAEEFGYDDKGKHVEQPGD